MMARKMWKCQNLLLEVGQDFRPDSGDNPVLNHSLNRKFQNHLLEVEQNFRPDSGVKKNKTKRPWIVIHIIFNDLMNKIFCNFIYFYFSGFV